jgi:hypothetical protein
MFDLRDPDPDQPLLIDRRASDADHMTDELEAIRTLGQVLARLPDTAARVRVLRWAAERFEIDTTVSAASSAALKTEGLGTPGAIDAIDQTLSTDSLYDLFPAAVARNSRERVAMDDALTMDGVLMDDALREEAAAPASVPQHVMVENTYLPTADLESLDVDAPVAQPGAAASGEAPRAESLIHSFVTDLQRLAQDCQTVFAPITPTPQ